MVIGEGSGGSKQVSRTLIVGAGFSRAISDRMPLTDELGNAVMAELRRRGQNFPHPVLDFKGGYFESWLSRLAEQQPDLDEAANLENQAWFTRISEAIHDVMEDREFQALKAEPPWWLSRLVGAAHIEEISIITFNYDTLIEHAVNENFLFDWNRKSRVGPGNVVNNIPPLPLRPGLIFGEPEVVTFRLIKLHGSLDSYWVPDDQSGATISRLELNGHWRDPKREDVAKRRRELPGRVPFIVPPAAAKSSFYGNPVIRELWRSAADAISSASEIALVGYSLPATDLVVSGMISERLRPSSSPIIVVNPRPAEVVQRLEYLGLERNRIKEKSGLNACADYVTNLEDAAARALSTSIRTESEDLPILVAIAEFWVAAVIDVRVEPEAPDRALLILEPGPVGFARATRPREPNEPLPLTLSSLREKMGGRTIMGVAFKDGNRASLISMRKWNDDTSPLQNWLVLIPSAVPRSSYQEI
jgi:hypothetical protein